MYAQGLQTVVGQVLPLTHDELGWHSTPWFLRAEQCFLVLVIWLVGLSIAVGLAAVGEGG